MLAPLLLAVDLAARWSFSGPPGSIVADVAAASSGRRVFAVALQNGLAILRSDDGGSTWERVLETLPGQSRITVAPDPHDPDRVLATTFHAGFSDLTTRLYRSLDGGRSWTLHQTLSSSGASEIAFDRLAPGTVYVSYDSVASIYRSVDGGATFEALPSPFAGALLAAAPDGSLAAAAAHGATFVSGDRGETWTPRTPAPVSPSCSVSALAIDSADSRLWYVGTSSPLYQCGEVFRSDDAGATWTETAPVDGPVSDLSTDPARPGLVYASTAPTWPTVQTGRVLASSDGGETWRDLELPLIIGARALALPADGSRLYAATSEGIYQRDLRRPRSASPPR